MGKRLIIIGALVLLTANAYAVTTKDVKSGVTPAEIVSTARDEGVHVVGLSILSGSHVPLVKDVVARMKEAGIDVPVIVGGIIPSDDAETLKAAGVAAVYTPKNFELNTIMADIVRIVENGAAKAA